MSENKKSLMEAVESKGAGIVIPMLNPKDLQVKISAVVPPAYADALECDKRWSERFKNQCEEIVDQHKDVLDFEDKDRIEGNKPVVAEKPARVEDQKITESLKEGWKDFKFIVKCNDGPKELVRVVAENKSKAEGYAKDMYAANHTTYADDRYNEWSVKDVSYLNEALYGMNQIEQFVKMADAIGLKTMDDFKDFMDREGQGKDVLTALYDYLHNEIGDLDFQAKDESLKESYQDVDSMSREELMDEIDGIYEWALKGKHIDITSIIEDPEVFNSTDADDEEGYFKGVPTDKLRGILKILRKMKNGGSLTKDDEKVFLSKNGSMNESLDFTNAAEIKQQLDKYSEQYLTITFKGSENWKHISDLLEEYNDGDEEEADLALDKLESIYGSEYKLLKALEVDEISEITAMDRGVAVTIKVDKDNLYHNYADLINNPSVNKNTIKILELDKPTVQSINTSSMTRDEMVDFIADYVWDLSDAEYEKFKDKVALNLGIVWDNLKEDPEEGVYPSFTDNGLRIIIDKIIKAKPVTESYNRFKGPDYKKYKSLKEGYLDNIKNPDYWQHQVDYQLEHFGRVGGGLIQDLDENGFYLNADNKVTKKIQEDTVKNSKGKWVNKGEEGTHGEFDTKKEADAQRKAMYANGYKESLTEDIEEESSTEEEELKEPEAEVKINLEKFKPWGKAVDTYSQIQEAGKMEDFERVLEEGWPDGIKDQTLNELLVEDKDWLAEVLDMEFIDKRVK